MASGQVLDVLSDDPAADADFRRWVARTGHSLLAVEREGLTFRFRIRKA